MNDLRERIDARVLGQQVIREQTEGKSPAFQQGFARACQMFAQEVLGRPENIHAMNQADAIKFESQLINFGTHAGKNFGEVPISYLVWLSDQNRQVMNYLASDRGQNRIESDDTRTVRRRR